MTAHDITCTTIFVFFKISFCLISYSFYLLRHVSLGGNIIKVAKNEGSSKSVPDIILVVNIISRVELSYTGAWGFAGMKQWLLNNWERREYENNTIISLNKLHDAVAYARTSPRTMF